ncbi:MAG: polyhydroxyalkanoic acid system family protein [Pseudorhodoplanes sp.]
MSKPFIVCIPHRLGRAEATRRLQGGLTRAAGQFPVLSADEETWTQENGADRMAFRVRALGQAVSGTVDVREEDVQLELNLPLLLRVFAERATETIQRQGKLLLEKK